MRQGDYKNTENIDIPLNNKPLSKQCCVYLLKAMGENTHTGNEGEYIKTKNTTTEYPVSIRVTE